MHSDAREGADPKDSYGKASPAKDECRRKNQKEKKK